MKENIGNWFIDRELYPPCLFHQHTDPDEEQYPGQKWVCTKMAGPWRCARCKKVAPQEIQDVANLADCYTYLNPKRIKRKK